MTRSNGDVYDTFWAKRQPTLGGFSVGGKHILSLVNCDWFASRAGELMCLFGHVTAHVEGCPYSYSKQAMLLCTKTRCSYC